MPRTGADSVKKPNQTREFSDRLWGEMYPYLVAFFGRRGLDPELSRDLAQDTVLRAWNSQESFAGRSEPSVWIRVIAVNVWRNWVRDRKTAKRDHREVSLDQAAGEDGFAVGEGRRLWRRTASDPEREAVEKQGRERIRSSLSLLPERQRECLDLWLDGWTYQEIADRLGVSLQTVRSSVSRGRARLEELAQRRERPGEAS